MRRAFILGNEAATTESTARDVKTA
jgi:hypothetical protein